MSREGRLAKNTIVLGIGNICSKCLVFVMVPFFSKWLTTSEYGTFELFTTYASLLIPIITLSCGEAVFRYLIEEEDGTLRKELVSTGFAVVIIGSAVVAVGIAIFFAIWNPELLVPFLVYMLSETLNSYLLAYLRGIKKLQIYSLANVLYTISTFVTVTFFVYFQKMALSGILYGYAAAYLISNIFIIISSRFWEYLSFSVPGRQTFGKLVRYSLPLIPNAISWWLVNVSDRTIIALLLGTSFNGIYAIANKVPAMCTAVFSVFHLSWQENASESVADGDRDQYYSKIFAQMISVLSSICICILACNFILFDYILDPKYAEAFGHVPILLSGVLFSTVSLFFGGIFIGLKQPKKNGSTTVIAAVFNVVIHLVLVKFIGLYAASLSTMVAYLFLCFIRYRLIRKEVTLQFPKVIFFYIAYYLYFMVTCYLNVRWLNFANIIIAALIFLIVNRRLISSVVNKIIHR